MTKEEFFNRSTLSHTWSWMKRFAEKGYFFDINNEPLKNNVKDMMDTLEAVYPNRWSFFFVEGYRFPRILIHFPCFEISNSEGRTHTIRDLYVMLHPFIYSGTGRISFTDSISGFRTTLTDAELNTGYLHSHLRSTNRGYFDNFDSEVGLERWFCLGSGETLDLLDIMNVAEEFDKNLFELFLYTLDSFVKWESLEGGPYKRMENIHLGDDNEGHIYDTIRREVVERAKDLVRNNTDLQHKLKYTFSAGNVAVIPDMEFEETLKKCFLDNNFMNGLCTYDGKTYWHIPEKYSNTLEYTGDGGFLFRGYRVNLKIAKTVYQKNKELLDTSTLIVHPGLCHIMAEYLNTRVIFKYLNYYARKRKIDEAREAVHQYRSVSGDNQEDTIPVQQYDPF